MHPNDLKYAQVLKHGWVNKASVTIIKKFLQTFMLERFNHSTFLENDHIIKCNP